MDHLERARREEEVPYLEAASAQRAEEDRAMYEASQAELSARHAEAWKVDIEEKHRWVWVGRQGVEGWGLMVWSLLEGTNSQLFLTVCVCQIESHGVMPPSPTLDASHTLPDCSAWC
jgi:hypothetical protein